MNKNIILIIILSSFIFQIACSQANHEQSNNRRPQPPKATPAVEEVSYKLGDTIELNGRKVIVYGFKPYEEARMKDLYNTSQGQALEVSVENTGDSPFLLSPLHFSVEDDKGNIFTYYDVKAGGKSPSIDSTKLAPGQKVRGFVTYANGDLNPAIVYYRSPDGKTTKITVK